MAEERDFKGIWIPKEIWLSKDLGWTEKILLAEIDSLSLLNECFASNEHFAEFLNLSKDRVSKIISELTKKGYIETKLIYKKDSKQVEKRVITTRWYGRKQLEGIGENNYTPIGENNYTPIGENNYTPIGENAEDINTVFINTNNICSKVDNMQLFNKFWTAYPKKVAKPNAEKAFKRIKVTEDILAIMLEAIDTMKSTTKQEYYPHPATWLNQKRWEDEIDVPQTGAKLIQTGDNSFKLE